jgi:hypothetical protein
MKFWRFCFLSCPILLSLFLPKPSFAQDHFTNEGFIACYTEAQLDKVISFALDKDHTALAGMIMSEQCVFLKPNIPVYVMESGWTVVKIRIKGSTEGVWTVREAIRK